MSPRPKRPPTKGKPPRASKTLRARGDKTVGAKPKKATAGKVPKSKRSGTGTTQTETKQKVRLGVGSSNDQTRAKGDRIAKVMARAGLCSRREAERWIEEGRVRVNGKSLKTPAYDVAQRDRIEVDGQPLPAREPVRLWRYRKPRGLVTTHNDPQGRKTVFQALPADLPRVISVGRLDYNTEGLLLLTNDGDLARYLELPATGWVRRYRVRAHGRVTETQLKSLSDGITVEGVKYGPIEAVLDVKQGSNQWLTIALREGKNREVRRVLGALGLEVNRLIRISYGPFQLLDLRPGQTDLVRRKTLADQMGPKLSEQFNLTGEEEVVSSPQRRGLRQRRAEPSDMERKPTRSPQRDKVKKGQQRPDSKPKRRPHKRRVK